MKTLAEMGLLVNLKIGQWSARKNDKKATREIEVAHNAHKAGNFRKALINADKGLKDINSIAVNARNELKKYSVAWNDEGERLIASDKFFDLSEILRPYIYQFEKAVEDFLTSYPDLKKEAKDNLNGLYNEKDYPTAEKLKAKFYIKLEPTVISDLTDLRISAPKEELERMKKEIQAAYDRRLENSVNDLVEKIREKVEKMVEKLKDSESIFRDSLVENIRELIDLLPSLNLSGNLVITEVREDMKQLLVEPDLLRNNDKVRQDTKKAAQDILNKMADYFG